MSETEYSGGNTRQTVDTVRKNPYAYVIPVRFRGAGKAYSFGTNDSTIREGDKVVVETAQGLEMGDCSGEPQSTDNYPGDIPLKPILRKADEQDQRDYEDNFEYSQQAFDTCAQEIKNMNLDMHLLSAEYTLDRSKVLFIYLSDQRVDFRELLKRLGGKLHCRIELRQIGERDKAKMVGGIGMCGMECCCSRFKTHFDVISINMAKNQLLALNIDKLSGQCGKLMCCLKYEDADYKELTKGLPKMGARMEYEGKIYRVTSMNVMSNQAKLENIEGAQFITMDELREKCTPYKIQPPQKKKHDGTDPEPQGNPEQRPQGARPAASSERRTFSRAAQENAQRSVRPEHLDRPVQPVKPAETAGASAVPNGGSAGSGQNQGQGTGRRRHGRHRGHGHGGQGGQGQNNPNRTPNKDAHQGLQPQNGGAVSAQPADHNTGNNGAAQ